MSTLGKPPSASEEERAERKLAELILYLADRCEGHADFGLTKLNKLLFLCDVTVYRHTRQRLTGSEYVALQRGPAPSNLERVRAALIDAGDLAIKRNGPEQRAIALRQPNLDVFSPQEIDLVGRVIQDYRSRSRRETSEFSHGFAGYHAACRESQVTGTPGVIPYDSFLIAPPQLDPFEEAHVLELARKYGWASRRSVRA